MNTKIKFALITAGVVLSNTVYSGVVFGNSVKSVEAYAMDAVAGQSNILRTSKFIPNTKVFFIVKKPSNELVKLPAKTSDSGVAVSEFSGYYTRLSGVYGLSVANENGGILGGQNSFTVYPAAVSETISTLLPKEQITRIYEEKSSLTVKLLDLYKNPIQGHLVKLISSSVSDKIEVKSKNNLTDENGEIVFEVLSENPTVSTYSAYDVTADKVLNGKAKVLYISGSPVSLASYSVGNSSFNVDSFKFEDVPEKITAGTSTTFKVSAYDSKNQHVYNYNGTIRFSASGGNAGFVELPPDYTFTVEDQGSHTFSLAANFKQAGVYTIKATDLGNSQVYGEQVFTVSEGGSSSANSSKKITITTPVSGVVGNNVQVVSGMASPGARIKIFDNETSIATINADASGNFSYTTGMLADGSHKIYVATVNDIDTIIDTSNIVDITIDVSAPEISQVVFDPASPVDPGTTVKVKAYIEEDLLQAKVIFMGNVYDMTKAQGYYETSVVMPIDFGEYDLEFKMTDQLGNETSVKGEHKITVGVFGGVETPKNVTNLTATPMDRKVILNWSAPENLLVDHYRVHYGMSPNKMTEAVDTFTDSTTWYISNLQNGINYYFAVVAVDVQGNTSQNFDKIVTAVPNPVLSSGASPDVLYGYGGADAIKDMKKDASESGPEVLWLLIPALLGGFCYSLVSRRKKEFI
jgi:hypothetical protein